MKNRKIHASLMTLVVFLSFNFPSVSSAQSSQICSNYKFLWNVGWSGSPLNIGSFPTIVDGRVFTLYDGVGLYPRYYQGQALNGGIPQLMNLEAHRAKVNQDVQNIVPGFNYDGMIIFDYETWPPQWDLLDTNDVHRTASLDLVRSEYPDWPQNLIVEEAKKQWEQAALDFWLVTIDAAREVRPQAKFGAYYLMNKIGYGGTANSQFRAYNDQLAPIWNKLDVIAVDIYKMFPSYGNGIPPNGPGQPPSHEVWYDDSKQYVRENILEGIRLKNTYTLRPKIVMAYAFPHYNIDNGPYSFQLLRTADLNLELIYPKLLGADGVVIWGASGFPNFNAFPTYLRDILGPMIENHCNPTPPNQTVNQAPQVNAGSDRSTGPSLSVTLQGSVTDDGLPNPPGVTSTFWTQILGPSSSVLSSPNSLNTTVTFSIGGFYTFRLTASDGLLSATDDVTISVNQNEIPVLPVAPEALTREQIIAKILELQQMVRDLQSLLVTNLTIGSKGFAVVSLQEFLVARGYLVMPPGVKYGQFGPLTRSAVARFQRMNNIYPASGYYGPITRSLVNRLR